MTSSVVDIICHHIDIFSHNKFASIVMPTYFQFVQVLIIETKFDLNCILTILVIIVVINDWKLDENHLASDKTCNIVNL